MKEKQNDHPQESNSSKWVNMQVTINDTKTRQIETFR